MPAATCRALVVEDDPEIARLLKHLLQRERYDVDVTNSSAEALRRISEDDYHLIVLDLKLRGTGGEAVIQWMRERSIHLLDRVVVVSAHPTVIRKEFPDRVCQLVAKPFEIEELLRAVRRCTHDCASGAHRPAESEHGPA